MTDRPESQPRAEDTNQTPADKGRGVGRPPALSVEQVIDAAIELADEAGLAGLSMPKLAARLDVGTMTLYGYVANKQDLLDRVASRIFEDLVMPEAGNWREALADYFRSFRRAALAHPTLAELLAGGRITIPEVFQTLETVLRTANDEEIHGEVAIRAFYAALTYTLGFVIWEIPRTRLQSETGYHAEWAHLLGQLDTDRHPLLTGPASGIVPTVASEEQFEWGLLQVIRDRNDRA